MGGHEAREYWEHVGLMKLMASLLVPVAAWFIDLQTSYAMVKWACDEGRGGLLLLVPAGSLILVATSGWLGWDCWTRLRREATDEGGRSIDRSRFLALAGLSTSAIFALLILVSLFPRVWLSPCE
jgi:hypothetical protein